MAQTTRAKSLVLLSLAAVAAFLVLSARGQDQDNPQRTLSQVLSGYVGKSVRPDPQPILGNLPVLKEVGADYIILQYNNHPAELIPHYAIQTVILGQVPVITFRK